MKAQIVSIHFSKDRIVGSTVYRPNGKKLLGKGHVITDDDIRCLENESVSHISVTDLETGEVGEDYAVCAVASEMGCGCYDIKLASGGRANLIATEDCCVLVDQELLKNINCMSGVVVATFFNFTFARAGQRIATVKSMPFAVAEKDLEGLTQMLREQGPILQARPIRNPAASVLYSDPVSGDRARQMFESIMRQRLGRFGVFSNSSLANVENEEVLTLSLQRLLLSKPSIILIASTTAPAGPEDAVGRALARVGGKVERYLAPVEPGNLLMLAYKGDVPIISAPGCFHSAKPNAVDLILAPLLARYRVSAYEVACLGHGGLLR